MSINAKRNWRWIAGMVGALVVLGAGYWLRSAKLVDAPRIDEKAAAVAAAKATRISSAEKTEASTAIATLSGIVQAAAGERIREASVAIYQAEALVAEVLTDADGRFAASIPPGATLTKVTADGYGAVIVRPSAPSQDVTVTLFPGYQVRGQVLHESNRKPVANVHVIAGRVPGRMLPIRDDEALTDRDGRFAFKSLPGGEVFLSVNDDKLLTVEAMKLVLGMESVVETTLLVRVGARIAGRFTIDSDNAPCPKGQLLLVSEEQSSSPNSMKSPLAALVKGDGLAHFAAISPGRYSAGAVCDEYQLISGPNRIDVGSGDASDLHWRFTEGLSVEVAVSDETQNAIADADIDLEPANATRVLSMRPRSVRADKQGRYRFGGLPEGDYKVNARSPGLNGSLHADAIVQVSAALPRQRVQLILPGIGRIRVHAHTASNEPVSRLLFHASNRKGERFEATYSGDGRYDVGPLPRGDYRLFAYDNKNPKIPIAGAGEWLVVNDADPVQIDFLYQQPDGAIEGVVYDANGQKLPRVLLRAVSTTLNSDDEFFSKIQEIVHGEQGHMTDEDGHFKIQHLDKSATYRLFLQGPKGQKLMQAGITPGVFVNVTFPALATLSGTAVDEQNVPIDDFMVMLRDVKSGERTARTFKGAGGRFVLAEISPGELEVAALSESRRLVGMQKITLPSGQQAHVRIVLTAANAQNMKRELR